MTFLQLSTFAEAARLGSFTAVAAKMNVTQSTVSTRIQELEQFLGVSLFDRSHRSITLTPKGRELVAYAQQAMLLHDQTRSRISGVETLSGILRLGVAETVAISWLADLVTKAAERYRNIAIELDIALTRQLMTKLEAGALDIVLVPSDSFDSSYVVRSTGQLTYSWMAGRDFIQPEKPLRAEDFKSLRILSLGEDSYHYRTICSWILAHGSASSLNLSNVCNSLSVLAMLTAGGLGVSLLPPSCFQRELKGGDLQLLNTSLQPPLMPFAVVYKSRENTLLQELIAELAVEVSTFGRDEKLVAGAKDTLPI